jgi:chromosome segregation ATPase
MRGVVATALLGGVGYVLVGTTVGSYIFTGGRAMRDAVADAVPIEFELRRAKDMIEELIPAMHANIRLIAKEEVEIESLQVELEAARNRTTEHRTKLAHLRDALRQDRARFVVAGVTYTRARLKQDMARRLSQCQHAEDMLAGKERLLTQRGTALRAAQSHLADMRNAKEELSAQVAALESQYRLVQASAAGTEFELKTTKLTEARKLLANIKKRLNVAQRILEKEQYFVDDVPVETVTDPDLLEQVDAYLTNDTAPKTEHAADQNLAANIE